VSGAREVYAAREKIANKAKIMTSFFQIAIALPFNLTVKFPEAYTRFLSVFSFLSFDIFPGLGMNCFVSGFDYTNTVASVTITPLIVGAVLALGGLARLFQRRNKDAQRFAYAFFILTYLVLINVSTTLFHMFKCRSFDEGGLYLYADYSVDCHSQHYAAYRSYSVFMVSNWLYTICPRMNHGTTSHRTAVAFSGVCLPDWHSGSVRHLAVAPPRRSERRRHASRRRGGRLPKHWAPAFSH